MKVIIAVNKKGSKGSRALAKALRIKRIKAEHIYSVAPTISWGHSKVGGNVILNKPDKVDIAADKRLTFAAINAANITTVANTTDRAVAESWYYDGKTVVARTKVRSACGKGIVICKEGVSSFVDAPLYTL
jgi:hypothetical protein